MINLVGGNTSGNAGDLRINGNGSYCQGKLRNHDLALVGKAMQAIY